MDLALDILRDAFKDMFALVLLRANRSTRENLRILGALYVIGVAWGLKWDKRTRLNCPTRLTRGYKRPDAELRVANFLLDIEGRFLKLGIVPNKKTRMGARTKGNRYVPDRTRDR